MLACARIGAIHSVVFGGLASRELASRIDDCSPKLIITASCGLEPNKIIKYKTRVDKAISLLSKKNSSFANIQTIIVQRKEKCIENIANCPTYWDYEELMNQEKEIAACVPVESTHPLYILCNNS